MRFVTVLLLGAVAHLAPGQVDGQDPREWFRAVIARLDSPDLATREKASRDLTTSGRVSLADVETALADSSLSCEQRTRLDEAGFALFAATDRGALGVTFSMFGDELDGTEITQTHAGFDAARLLRPGDVLRGIGGVATPSFPEARVQIVSYDPGEEIELSATRAGEAFVARVKLGSLTALRGGSPRDDVVYRGAWRARLLRKGVAHAEPLLECGLSAERIADLSELIQGQVSRAMQDLQRRQLAQARMNRTGPRQALPAPSRVVAGGSARAGEPYSKADFAVSGQRTRLRGMASIERDLEAMREKIRLAEAQLAGEDLKGNDRRIAEANLADLRMKLNTAERERRRALGLVEP